MKAPSEADKKKIVALQHGDVLFGRGGHANNHPGNRRYQSILETRAWEYSRLKGRNAKTKLAWEIVHQMKSEGTRFLHRDKATVGGYFEASCDDIRKKVSQRLREMALDVKEHERGGKSGAEPVPDEVADETSPISLGNKAIDEDSVLVDNGGLLASCLFQDDPMANKDPINGKDPLSINGYYQSPIVRKDPPPSSGFQPEMVLSSSGISFPVVSDPDSSERAVCGSLDDLSDCDFSTLAPLALDLSVYWSQETQFDTKTNTANAPPTYPSHEKLVHSFPDHDFKIGRATKRPRTSHYGDRSSSDEI